MLPYPTDNLPRTKNCHLGPAVASYKFTLCGSDQKGLRKSLPELTGQLFTTYPAKWDTWIDDEAPVKYNRKLICNDSMTKC